MYRDFNCFINFYDNNCVCSYNLNEFGKKRKYLVLLINTCLNLILNIFFIGTLFLAFIPFIKETAYFICIIIPCLENFKFISFVVENNIKFVIILYHSCKRCVKKYIKCIDTNLSTLTNKLNSTLKNLEIFHSGPNICNPLFYTTKICEFHIKKYLT